MAITKQPGEEDEDEKGSDSGAQPKSNENASEEGKKLLGSGEPAGVITKQPGAEEEEGKESDGEAKPDSKETANEEEKKLLGSGEPTDQKEDGEQEEEEDLSHLPQCLQVLSTLEGVMVEQRIEILELVSSFEGRNSYDVRALSGMPLLHLVERSNCLLRNCKGRRRGFKMKMVDYSGREVAVIKRSCKCCEFWCFDKCNLCCSICCCCSDSAKVKIPSTEERGFIRQRCGLTLDFDLYENGNRFAYVKGPSCCGCGCCTCCFLKKTFKVYSTADGSRIGSITKLFAGVLQEYHTDADTFKLQFPTDLSLTAKITMIAATILIDFIAFEDNEGKKKYGKKDKKEEDEKRGRRRGKTSRIYQSSGMVISKQPGEEDEYEKGSEGEGSKDEGNKHETPKDDKQSNLPQCLKVLNSLEGVIIEQRLELLEMHTKFEGSNKYDLLHLAEKSNCCLRNCKGRRRGFKMKVLDFSKREVAVIRRPCKCCECCCFDKCNLCCSLCCCCSDSARVEIISTGEAGSIQQRCGITLDFDLFENGNRFAYVKGPSCCGCGCCTCCFLKKEFKVYSSEDGSRIGSITKLFAGVLQEYKTDADTYKLLFPTDLSLTAKMTMIAATILIDFIAFEDNEGKKKYGKAK
ncbi:hypothetical protein Q1695_007617 [Nippostrongylus brasiliensis]|nr:hypothetical protein Q1695_007617 [Nippostrongylus brasiliensis]